MTMSDYIKREDAENIMLGSCDESALWKLRRLPPADVVEVGIITCLGIKFMVEDDIIKVKWRHGDKHYIAPLAGLLELWEKYEEQEHE